MTREALWSAGFPRRFAVAVYVIRVAHGIGDIVDVAGEWVTYEAITAVEISVGITHQGQGRGRNGRLIATVAGQFAGLVSGLGDAVGIAGPAHGVRDVVEITGSGRNCVGAREGISVTLLGWLNTFYTLTRRLRMRSEGDV